MATHTLRTACEAATGRALPRMAGWETGRGHLLKKWLETAAARSTMIYFIQNTVTKGSKIGNSKNPKKRLDGLQTATPDKLVLLGAIQGGLEHETALHVMNDNYSSPRVASRGNVTMWGIAWHSG